MRRSKAGGGQPDRAQRPVRRRRLYSRVDSEHNRTTAGVSMGNRIDSNQITNNNLPRSAQINDSDGVRIETLSVFNVVTNNSITGSGLDGIAMFSFAPHDGNPSCDNNTWRGNVYRTANQPCTTIGGTQV